jgi:hypothetical protein
MLLVSYDEPRCSVAYEFNPLPLSGQNMSRRSINRFSTKRIDSHIVRASIHPLHEKDTTIGRRSRGKRNRNRS